MNKNKFNVEPQDFVKIPDDVGCEVTDDIRETASRRTGFQDHAAINAITVIAFDTCIEGIRHWAKNPHERPASIKVWIKETTRTIAEQWLVPQLRKVAYATVSPVMRTCSEQEKFEIVEQSIEIYFIYVPKWDACPWKLPRNVTCWIGQVAKNRALQWMKRQASILPIQEEEALLPLNHAMNCATPSRIAEQRETRDDLLRLIKVINEQVLPSMSPEDQKLWYAFHFDRKSKECIASELNIKVATVARQWLRLTLKVRAELEARIEKDPALRDLFIEMQKEPKCFSGLANLSRMLRVEGGKAVENLAESFCDGF